MTLKHHFKLGIIGGGIAGSYAAYLASRRGINVEVFERTPKRTWFTDPLATRRCGEGVWKRKLEDAGIEFSLNSLPGYVENFTETLLLGRLKQDKLTFLEAKIDPYLFINRQTFEMYFHKRALKLGTIWHFRENVADFQDWKKKNSFDLIFGAWGTDQNLTSQVIKNDYNQEFVLACQYTLTGVDSTKIENAKTLILTDDPTVRYFYIFPKGESDSVEANVGVGLNGLNIKRPFLKLNQLLKLNPLGALSKAKVLRERTFAKILDSGPPLRKETVLENSLFLVGDAGFTTDAISGGGIGYGLLAAKEAVESCFAQSPKQEFYDRLDQLIKQLEISYQVSQKLYPRNMGEKRKINDQFFAVAKDLIRRRGLLSLGKIAKEILLK